MFIEKLVKKINDLKLHIRVFLIPSFLKSNTENYLDGIYAACKKRDRTQSFNDWVDNSIRLMAIEEVESGNLHQKTAEYVKEKWGSTWELFYPEQRIFFERDESKHYLSVLKKMDDKIEEDRK